jgi:NADPH2:quinone reductase
MSKMRQFNFVPNHTIIGLFLSCTNDGFRNHSAQTLRTTMSMKAIAYDQTGDVSVLQYRDVPIPVPKEGEVLIRVKAAGVNFVDVYVRNGLYKSPVNILGREGAGVIEALGADVTGFKVGDKVVFFSDSSSGAYAELCTVRAADATIIPDGVDFETAAALPIQGMTAHYLVHSTFKLDKEHIALIHAGAGGTGRLVIQLAKKLGARVITTVSTHEKAEIAKAAGADDVIIYTETPFDQEVLKLTDGKGVHVVYDSVGAKTWEQSLNSLRKRGHLVLFGNASGPVPAIDPLRLARQGSISLTRPRLADYLLTREESDWRMNDLFSAIKEGKLVVSICARIALANAAEAHNFLEGRKTTGKIVLIPGDVEAKENK